MAQETSEKIFRFSNPDMAINLVGINDANLTLIEEGLNVRISPFGDELRISGEAEAVSLTLQLLEAATKLLAQGIKLSPQDIASAVAMAKRGTLEYFADMYSETLLRDAKGQPIRIKNFGQRQYVDAIKHNDITFGIGPAGTGKNFSRRGDGSCSHEGRPSRADYFDASGRGSRRKVLAFSLVISRKRLILICVRFMTLYMQFWGKNTPIA